MIFVGVHSKWNWHFNAGRVSYDFDADVAGTDIESIEDSLNEIHLIREVSYVDAGRLVQDENDVSRQSWEIASC